MTGVIVIAWYLFVATASAIADVDNLMWIQIGMWVLAVITFVCGIVSLNARMARELRRGGVHRGVAAGLLSVTIGLSAARALG